MNRLSAGRLAKLSRNIENPCLLYCSVKKSISTESIMAKNKNTPIKDGVRYKAKIGRFNTAAGKLQGLAVMSNGIDS
jgi:hypothetical protein